MGVQGLFDLVFLERVEVRQFVSHVHANQLYLSPIALSVSLKLPLEEVEVISPLQGRRVEPEASGVVSLGLGVDRYCLNHNFMVLFLVDVNEFQCFEEINLDVVELFCLVLLLDLCLLLLDGLGSLSLWDCQEVGI